jgi:hypothetical protein
MQPWVEREQHHPEMKNTNVNIASQQVELLRQIMGVSEHPQVTQCCRDAKNEPCNFARVN